MLLLQQMIIMFLLMSVGFVGSKIGMITEETSKRLSAIVVNIANPAMILVSGISDERMEGRELLSLTVVILAIYAVLLLLAYLLPALLRVDPKSRGVYQAMTVFSNIGFMGYPIIAALYGSSAVLYGALYSIPFNILIYTFGVSALRKKENGAEKKKLSLKEVLNIGVITSIISLILYLWQIRVPGFLTDTLSYLGNLTAPLSMMVIGASMTSISLRELFTDVRLLLFSLIKLLLIPVLPVPAAGSSLLRTGTLWEVYRQPVPACGGEYSHEPLYSKCPDGCPWPGRLRVCLCFPGHGQSASALPLLRHSGCGGCIKN